jgi:uncharacterized OB-fold protein
MNFVSSANTSLSAKVSSPAPRSLPGDALSHDGDGRPVLVGGVCCACGARAFPLTPVCANCMSEKIDPEPMSRQGTLYSFTVVHVGPKTWDKPYAVGYVDLDNAVRVFSHLRGPVVIGQTVELATAAIGKDADGTPVTTFVFEPKKA